jgi:hypothetical protein
VSGGQASDMSSGSTLVAVVVGGVVAGTPAVVAALVSGRSARQIAREEVAIEALRARTSAYEAFLNEATPYRFLGWVTRNAAHAIAHRRGEKRDSFPGGADEDSDLQRLMIRLSLHASAAVRDKVNEFREALDVTTGSVADIVHNAREEGRDPDEKLREYLTNPPHNILYRELSDMMWADINSTVDGRHSWGRRALDSFRRLD